MPVSYVDSRRLFTNKTYIFQRNGHLEESYVVLVITFMWWLPERCLGIRWLVGRSSKVGGVYTAAASKALPTKKGRKEGRREEEMDEGEDGGGGRGRRERRRRRRVTGRRREKMEEEGEDAGGRRRRRRERTEHAEVEKVVPVVQVADDVKEIC